MEPVQPSTSGNRGSIHHPMWCIEAIRKKSLISYHFPSVGKMITFSPHISRPTLAHQLLCKRTSAVMQAHITWCASAQQLMCGLRYYIFQQFLLYLPATSIIYLKDLLYLPGTFPISFDNFPYIPQRSPLYFSASGSVSLVFPTSIFPYLWFLVNFPRFLRIFHL